MRIGIAALCTLLPAVAAAQELEVSLAEAVRRALQVQPAMVEAQGDVRTAAASGRSALGAYLPTVTTNASASRSNIGRVDFTTGRQIPPEYTYTVGLSASLELFDGFRRLGNRNAAAASHDAAEAGAVNQRFQVTLETERLFYDAIAREELVRVAQAQVRRAQQQLAISVEKLRAGSATRSDSLRSTVDLGNARLALLQAEANLATAQANLGRQIGVEGLVRAVPDTGLPALPDTAGLRSLAAADAPTVQQAEAQARAARAQVWSARAQYWPTFTVSYSDNRQGTGSPFQNFSNYPETFSWRFGLSWTLFNGFTREQNQVNASAQRDLAEARALDARRRLSAELTQQLAALFTAYAQIEIARANVAAAAEDLRVQQERYRVGVATILELLTSQANLTQAEVNLVQARFNYLIARAQLEAVVGREL